MTRIFIFYGLLGWVVEVIWTGLSSLIKGNWALTSHTYLWMFPIYGLAIFLQPVHEEIRAYKWWVRGLVYMSIIFFIEYLTGFLLHRLVGVCPWDYSDKFFSFHGYIRLDYGPVWFVAGLLFEQIHDNFVKVYLR